MAIKGRRRDPVSLLFDTGARRVLDRAYAAPGRWVTTRITAPSDAVIIRFAADGIRLTAPDPAAGGEARTRWMRGFVRAVYYQHKWYSHPGGGRWERRASPRTGPAIEVEVGRWRPALGVIPAGRQVRVRTRPGGEAAKRAVRQMPAGERTYAYDPRSRRWSRGARWSDPGQREWF